MTSTSKNNKHHYIGWIYLKYFTNILENIEMLPKGVGHFVKKIFLTNFFVIIKEQAGEEVVSKRTTPLPLNYREFLRRT